VFRAARWSAVILTYGDESADETKESVFAVAGVVGSEDDWQLAIRACLRRTRGIGETFTDDALQREH
jgi:hypothetical protein